MLRICTQLVFGWLLLASVFTSASQGEDPGVTLSLFNGENLNGWHVDRCDAVVRDGAILLKDGNGLVRADHRYADFILELDWRALGKENWDSGIYLRCELPDPNGKRPWPKRYQVNLLKGQEGNLLGIPGTTSTGLIKNGDWNHFKLTVKGSAAEMEINGKPAWKGDGLESLSGYLGFQAEVPGGGQFLFKNIKITELGYRSLFNGKDLTGWEGGNGDASKCWTVEDGLLICTGEKGPWLRSTEEFDDFNLRLEYRVKPGGNSGVFCRVPKNGNHHGKDSGVEIQILDDKAKKYSKLKDYQYTGSVYDIAGATQHVGRPAGEWNSLEINCHGPDYRVIHNGIVIIDARLADFPLLAERLKSGYLGLQNHSEHVWFRNLRIGPPMP